MDGDKTGKSLGVGTFKLGEESYDTILAMGDVRNYIKKIKSISLQLEYWKPKDTEESIIKIDEISDGLLDYKQKIVQDALVRAGMSEAKADELCSFHYSDIIKDGRIEVWLGFISEDKMDKEEKLKN